MIPRDDRLTVQELVTDKIELRKAYTRKQVRTETDQLLAAGRSEEALALLNRVKTEFGEDRNTLLAERAVLSAVERVGQLKQADAKIARLRASRLP